MTLQPLAAAGDPVAARRLVESLGLRGSGRRVVAVMIASVDGRAAVAGRSVGLGHPADRALLRELRTASDAILVGTRTLAAERYANLLDPDQRAHRRAAGLPDHPVVVTVSRKLAVPDIPLLHEAVPVVVYTEAAGDAPPGVEVRPLAPLTIPALLEDLDQELVLCEGGPALLREVAVQGCLDDLFLTVVAAARGGGGAHDPRGRCARSTPRAGARRCPLRRRSPLPPLSPPMSTRPRLMGIVNASPDSFSDAVRLPRLEDQVAHALRLVAEGADVIDVGGESGVTHTPPTAADVESERVVPLVAALAAEGVTVSVDTWKPEVADGALGAGATILNDTSGLRDPALADIAARHGAALVVMHTRAAPKERHFPGYGDGAAADVGRFLAERVQLARERGVRELIVDPGPDFAKTPAETVDVLRAIDSVRALGLPWLAAVSRKYFVGVITGRPPGERLAGTLAAVGWATDNGAAIVRVHDVRAAADFLAVRSVLQGEAEVPDYDPDDESLKWIRPSE